MSFQNYNDKKIYIMGAGIAGLTTAIALRQNGIKTTIFEQASEISPVGAGIILANNAMQVYEKLGLRQQIEEQGKVVSSINILDAKLKTISKQDLSIFTQKNGVSNIAIHRANLHEILVNKYQQKIKLNHRLNDIKQNHQIVDLYFANHNTENCDILIGADGLHSTVRSYLTGQHNIIRQAGQYCWRGVADYQLPAKYQSGLYEVWGKGERFGFVEIGDNQVYWYALKSISKNKNELKYAQPIDFFKQYDDLIQDLIKTTKKHSIHTAQIEDLKPMPYWYSKNICLLGDAAHATTPNMGQGACQAIEDAWVLAQCLHDDDSVENAFYDFQKRRMSKAHYVVNNSWHMGKVSHWQNPLAIFLRNNLMRLMPEYIYQRQLQKIFEIDGVIS